MSRKRQADAAAPLAEDKLQRVTRALENAARTGATFASAASDQYPPPAIAFKSEQDVEEQDADDQDEDDGEELLLPLRKRHTRMIKARGTVSQRQEERATAWDVDGALLESRNPKWREFLDQWLMSKRETLGIAPSAAVEVTLRKMVLAEAGARLDPFRDGEARGAAVFGTLLVVLPSVFKGGEFVVQYSVPWYHEDENEEGGEEATKSTTEQEDGEAGASKTKKLSWQTATGGNVYGISYAAFYDNCEYVSEPVRDGQALCLVYDLITTTPTDVPLFGGAALVQQSVNSALRHYFDTSPAPLAKRLKIGTDAWRAVYGFVVQRQFVYVVSEDTFEDLYGDQRQILASLAAFCDQSDGEYVLYHANLICSRSASARTNSVFDNGSEENATNEEDIHATLTAPWMKYGESEDLDYPPIFLRDRDQVAPSGQLANIPYWHRISDSDEAFKQVLTKLHGDVKKTKVYSTYALVILPSPVEFSLIAKLSMPELLVRLRASLTKSRDDALQFARRVIHYRPEWYVEKADFESFEEFVEIVVKFNDRKLFTDLLLAVDSDHEFPDSLSDGIKHVGWDSCVEVLVKSILSKPTLGGRVNLILSLVDEDLGAERLNPLLDALLSLHPWSNVKVKRVDNLPNRSYIPTVDDFIKLLLLVNYVCSHRIPELVSVTDSGEMVRLVVPALMEILSEYDEKPAIRAALPHVWKLFQPMLVEIRNASFAAIRVPQHCQACDQLQAFLTSSATETHVEVSEASEVEHMRVSISQVAKHPFSVRVIRDGDGVRLVKRWGLQFTGLIPTAERQAKQIQKMLSTIETKPRDDNADESVDA